MPGTENNLYQKALTKWRTSGVNGQRCGLLRDRWEPVLRKASLCFFGWQAISYPSSIISNPLMLESHICDSVSATVCNAENVEVAAQ